MALVRQASFSGGELSPRMWGRSDLSKYHSGLRTCKNFFISQHGAAVSRPGFKFVADLPQFSGYDENYSHKLIPFVYSDTVSYVLVFGNQYVKIFRDGSEVAQLATPYVSQTNILALKYAQVGNYMVITSSGHPPYELIRHGNTTWTFTPVDFSLQPYIGAEPCGLHPLPTADADHPLVAWEYMVTDLRMTDDGRVVESLPRKVTRIRSIGTGSIPPPMTYTAMPEFVAVYHDRPLTIDFRQYGLLNDAVGTRVYRGRKGVYGFVGEVRLLPNTDAGGQFIDYGHEPDYFRPPPQGKNPFEVRSADGALIRTERPTAVGFYQQRMFMGGTPERPEYVWGSAINDYTNFDTKLLSLATDALELELASRKREVIQSILGLDKLLIFTNTGVWAVGSAEGAITPVDVIDARVQTEIGSSRPQPIVVGDGVLYVRNKGMGVRDLYYQDSRRTYTGGDLSLLAEHLFEEYNILDWCYAEDPWGVVWAARADGKLLSLTYSRDHEMWAWAQHDTQGSFQAICSVPEGKEDVVYAVVRRTINGVDKWFLERMATRRVKDVKDYVGLDSSKTYFDDKGTLTAPGFQHLAGMFVTVIADGNVYENVEVYGGGTIQLPGVFKTITAGLPYTCDLELLDTAEAREKWKIVKKVTWELEGSRGIKAGEAFDRQLYENLQRSVVGGFGYNGSETHRAEVTISAGWNKYGRAVLRQTYPLPVIVLGVTREGETS